MEKIDGTQQGAHARQSKLVILNGPAGCGKSEAVACAKKVLGGTIVDRSCKVALIELTKEHFGTSDEKFDSLYNNRDHKETASPALVLNREAYNALVDITGISYTEEPEEYISIREAMIYVSEVLYKPEHGQDYFGVARADAIQPREFAIDDSGGFVEELPPVIDKLGAENILIIRVFGRGSYKGDSRYFLPADTGIRTLDVINTGTLASFLIETVNHIGDFYAD